MVYYKATASVLIAIAVMAPAIAANPVPKVDSNVIQSRHVSEGKLSKVKDESHHTQQHNHRAAHSSGTDEEVVTIIVHNDLKEEVNGDNLKHKPHRNDHRKGHSHRRHGANHKHSDEMEIEEDITIIVRPEDADIVNMRVLEKSVDPYSDESYERPHRSGHRYSSYGYEAEDSDYDRPQHHRYSSGHRHAYRFAGHRHSDSADDQIDDYEGNNAPHKHHHSPRRSSHRKAYHGNDDSRASRYTEDIEGHHSSHHRRHHNHKKGHRDDESRSESSEEHNHYRGHRMERNKLSDNNVDSESTKSFGYNDLD
ncbi:hypothetical protein CPB83DRAFT_908578 [Crepidotus variabilis]|uniref:Uncharacterized protein n=1 Tax=Crepidotus variabilis TaxID=179855 RepID=A0A9P6EBR0_9AGAR|nr:hypothetical protein CPB83DRAFT_908578 [Crepidotus variabilis]